MKFLEEVKKELRPDLSVLNLVELFVEDMNRRIKTKNINAVCVKGGSVAKGTFLKGDFDIDLFVCFDRSYDNEKLSDLLEQIIKDLSPTRVHGSRDYFQLKKDGLNYELVPVLDITSPENSKNVTDMSPYHVNWVTKNLKKGQEDEIRLTKKFLKASKLYGAESYIQGFSGHVVDILVIYYGSFLSLLKKSSNWKKPVLIDVENYYKNKQEVLFNLNRSKIQGPMIVIDPILKTRNAAAALSNEKFTRFKKISKEFLGSPSKDYFEEKVLGKTELKKKYKKNICLVNISVPDGKRDVVGSKILKAYDFLKKELSKIGFEILASGWEWNKKNKALYWFNLKNMILEEKRIVKGPPSDMKLACEEFRKKYDVTFEKDGFLFSEVINDPRELGKNIETLSKNVYFSEKVDLNMIEIIE